MRVTADDINPALPIIRNIPQFPQLRNLEVMQGLHHQTVVSSYFVDIVVPEPQ